MLSSHEIRESFLAYFDRYGHRRVASSSLVPAEDPTLLFTNAGMVQFKNVFTGHETRDYRRAASAQRCLRAGGKHNDLENVGATARHHTFFEMLGNFSFGDYFKEGAIEFAYGLLVGEWKLDPTRMLFTVFQGNEAIAADNEARKLWRQIAGVADDRIIGLGMADNFWAMGETGPCGPCSEIHYFLGDDIACEKEAAGGRCDGPACDCDRWTEVWNLVFMQYDRSADGTLTPLPRPSIDTGMGLERIAAVIQGKRSNYEIDLFQSLIAAAGDLTKTKYGKEKSSDLSLRVLADHFRASAFLIADGIYPSNEGRGYVLRRIMRRMIRHARLLDVHEPVVYRLMKCLTESMGSAYPILDQKAVVISDAIRREEEAFLATLDRGMGLLDEEIANTSRGQLDGALVFKLYDTFGFPPDLTEVIARERGMTVDQAGFDREMAEQRERSRKASTFAKEGGTRSKIETATEFLGYTKLESDSTVLEALIGEDATAEEARVILDRTPFYAESGGQVGDRGVLVSGNSKFIVKRTEKDSRGVYAHVGNFDGPPFAAGATVRASVDRDARIATERNHTATHLLHAALRKTLGDHVQQAGSAVGPDRLRFDFSHFSAMTPEEIAKVERDANDGVIADLDVTTQVLPIEQARTLGAMAFFGDKYGDLVRVVSVEGVPGHASVSRVASREFCGGTHVRRSGEIGPIQITVETAVAAGIRRIEAVTGDGALRVIQERDRTLTAISQRLTVPSPEIPARLEQVLEERKKMLKELARMRVDLALTSTAEIAKNALLIEGIPVAAIFMDELDKPTMRTVADKLLKSLGSGIIILGTCQADENGQKKAGLLVQISKELTAKIKAGDVVSRLAKMCDGGGGGRPEMAEAGGKNGAMAAAAVKAAPDIVRELLVNKREKE